MICSYIIITANRRERLRQTLHHLLHHSPLPPDQFEILVVDNASTDNTPAMLRDTFPDSVTCISLPENCGMPARNVAIRQAQGQYLVLLDDDSYPLDDAVPQSIRHMDQHPDVAAVVGKVQLSNGHQEASAFPSVMIGCATCIRRSTLDQVGLFPEDFFRQAEEYDLSFRILDAGFRIVRLENITYRHDKHLEGRSSALTASMDLLNNLKLTQHYLPATLRHHYRRDWLQRYVAIAKQLDHHHAIAKALHDFRHARHAIRSRPLKPATLELIFQLDHQRRRVADWAKTHRIRNVAIADLGKNIFATWRACRLASLTVTAIASNAPAFQHLSYRNITLLPDSAALPQTDGLILSNINPAQAPTRLAALQSIYPGPILSFIDDPQVNAAPHRPATAPEGSLP